MAKKLPNPTDRHVGGRVRMRRLMLKINQTELGNALGITFQQVQKNEKGTNRIGASRLHQLSHLLEVPVSFFFEGAPRTVGARGGKSKAPSLSYVTDFLATTEGLALTKSFMLIKNRKLKRCIVDLVKQVAGGDDR
jgi:transcriptional regulator with XRE-family HTH domain